MPTTTFWTEPTDEVELSLRTYWEDPSGEWQSVEAPIGRHPARVDKDGSWLAFTPSEFKDDERWPEGPAGAKRAVNLDPIYRRPDTGETWPRRQLPPGAMFDGRWLPYRGEDGVSLVVILPNGSPWHVDSKASNCTRPDEDHHCWVRHGDPRTEPVTVDKNGNTCDAGAGSIQSFDYHGFLTNGILNP